MASTRETKNEATEAIASIGVAAAHASFQAREVGVDDLLVARDREQQRDVDVDPARGQLLDRRHPGVRGGDLDHHVGSFEPVPQLDGLLDGGRGVVGEVGRALEGDEPVAPGARVVDGPQQVGGPADVLERELEEQLLRVTDTGGDALREVGRHSGPSP